MIQKALKIDPNQVSQITRDSWFNNPWEKRTLCNYREVLFKIPFGYHRD